MQKETPKPQNNKALELAAALARIAAGAVFTASGFLKLIKPAASFAAVIETYKLIPDAWSLPLAYFLPWAELFLGTFLITGYLTRLSSLGIAGLLGMFLTALGSSKIRGIDLAECGCFGGNGFGPHLSPSQTMIMDLFLIGMVILIWRVQPKILSLDRWIEKGRR